MTPRGILAGAAVLAAVFVVLLVWHPLDAHYYAERLQEPAPTLVSDHARKAHLDSFPPDSTTVEGRAVIQAESDRDREEEAYLHVACSDPAVFTHNPVFPRHAIRR